MKKKFLQKWIALLLAVLTVLSLSACGSVDKETVEVGLEVLDAVLDEMQEIEAEMEAEEAAGEDSIPDELPPDEQLPEEVITEPEEPVPEEPVEETPAEDDEPELLDEYGTYTSKEDVALYIHTYGRLPDNFISKKEAEKLGWPGGSLEPYAPGMCIGGSRFGNYEKLLPEAKGRTYTECDIDTLGASKRGAKRIVFSNDGLIYYTDDHYESFELLYGEE
jgi:hypothetical protein